MKYKVSFWTSNKNYVLFGGKDGAILQMSRDLNYQLWKSFNHKLFAFQLNLNDILASIGVSVLFLYSNFINEIT